MKLEGRLNSVDMFLVFEDGKLGELSIGCLIQLWQDGIGIWNLEINLNGIETFLYEFLYNVAFNFHSALISSYEKSRTFGI